MARAVRAFMSRKQMSYVSDSCAQDMPEASIFQLAVG